MRSFLALRSVDPGYDTRDVFTFQFAPGAARAQGRPELGALPLDFLAWPRSGRDSVGIVENVPLDEGTRGDRFRSETCRRARTPGGPSTGRSRRRDYFRTMAIDVLDGRPFDTADHLSVHGNVVISRSAAQQLFPGQRAVGRRLQQQGQPAWHTVVGVVEDVMQYGFRDKPQALLYFPLVGPTPTSWSITTPAYVIKTARAEAIAPEVRTLIRQVAPEAPMYRAYTMAGLAARSMVALSFTLLTLVVRARALLGARPLWRPVRRGANGRGDWRVRMARRHCGPPAAMVVAQGARAALGVAIGPTASRHAAPPFLRSRLRRPDLRSHGFLMLVIGGSRRTCRRAGPRVDPVNRCAATVPLSPSGTSPASTAPELRPAVIFLPSSSPGLVRSTQTRPRASKIWSDPARC